MKKAEITLVPLKEFDREQFIIDNYSTANARA